MLDATKVLSQTRCTFVCFFQLYQLITHKLQKLVDDHTIIHYIFSLSGIHFCLNQRYACRDKILSQTRICRDKSMLEYFIFENGRISTDAFYFVSYSLLNTYRYVYCIYEL